MANAIVVGSTGLIGGYLIQQLSEGNQFDNIYGVVRREGSLPDLPRVSEVVVDFESLDLSHLNADVIFCALGTTMKTAGSKTRFYAVDHDYVIKSGEEGKKIGVKHFLMVSSIGASASSWTYYLKVKGLTEGDLIALGFEKTSIFRPSLLLGPRQEHRFGEKLGESTLRIIRPLMVGGLQKQIPVHASQVAAAMIDQCSDETPGVFQFDSNFIRTYAVKE